MSLRKNTGTVNIGVLFEMYKDDNPIFFSDIVFLQFEEQMKTYFKVQSVMTEKSYQEELDMLDDLSINPRQTRNSCGEFVFDLHPAKELFTRDMTQKAHKGVTPCHFQATCPEYLEFDLGIFRQWMYKEVRFQKYCNHLEDSRTKKRDAIKKKCEKQDVKNWCNSMTDCKMSK